MPRFPCSTHALGSFFLSALLPPLDDQEESFYQVLGLDDDDNSATDEEIRKAYRKLSLKLHPDKIAQFGGGADASTKEAAAKEYEKIQEAYQTLSDEKKRIQYDALKSPTRYRFVERGGFADPQSLYENLIGASFRDKSRLVGLFCLVVLLVLMQPILVAAKINQELSGEGPLQNSSWIAILVPFWVMGALWIVLNFVASFFVSKQDVLPLCLAGVEQIFWYTGILFLCYKWDGKWDDSVPYREALIPIYIAMSLRWFRTFWKLQNLRKDVNRMVTSDYIEHELLKGRSMEELPEEEQDYILQAFIVVSPSPEFLPSSEDLTDEELEEEKVGSSPEFESAIEIYNTMFYGLATSLVFGILFLVLLTLKLDDKISGSWWAVFSPFWIERGGRLAYSLYKCCFGGIAGDEVVLYAGDDGIPVPMDGNNTEQESKDDDGDDDDNDNNNNNSSSSNPDISTNEEKTGKVSKLVAFYSDDNQTADVNSSSGENDAGAEEKPSATTDATSNVSGGNNNNDGDEIHLDQDTYDAFQSAYQEADEDERQERAKSCTEACLLIFQIIILCLVVAKIEKNYDSVDPTDVGFNVFWILFPFFLFFGCILCCCAVLIFGAAPEDLQDEVGEAELDPENPPINNDDENGGVATTLQEEEDDVAETPNEPEETVDELTPESSEQVDDGNMDDLD